MLPSLATRLGIAGANEQPMAPGLEAIGVSQGGQIPPRVEEGLLGGVLGQAGVTQDPACHRVHGVADASDERVEGLFIAVHRPLDELALHVFTWGTVR